MATTTDGSQRRRHLVIVGVNYAPELSGIAPYTTAMAEHLAAQGDEITVVTGMPHYPQWRVAPGYRGKLFREERTNGVRILRFASYVPAAQSAMKRGLFEGSFLISAIRAARRIKRPDAILGVVPALADAVVARMLAARFRIAYGLVFQDTMGRAAAQSGIAGGGRVAAVTTRLEAWAARRARVVATVSERFIPYLVDLGIDRERIMNLPNWTHTDTAGGDRDATRDRFGWSEGNLIVLHTGNMGLKQNLEQVLAAARLAQGQSPHVRFVLVGDGNQRAGLERQAAGLPNVEFHPFQPPSTFPDVLAAADVLLVSERATAFDMSLPSKLTSYFAAGRPILAVVSPDGATAQEIERSGGGVVVPPDQPDALLDAAIRLREDGSLAHRIAESGQAYSAESLNPELAAQRAQELVDRLVASGPRIADHERPHGAGDQH